MTNDVELRVRVLLTLQVALLGAVTPSMRAVLVTWNEGSVFVRVVFDGRISQEKFETVNEIEAEVIAHLPDHLVACKAEASPKNGLIDMRENEVCVFRRAG